MNHLFVYGSLKRGQWNSDLMPGKFLREAITENKYKLYDCGDFPGLLNADPGFPVMGEIWEVDDEGLAKLDQFEGVDRGLYYRGLIEIRDFDKPIFAYFWNRDFSESGRFGNAWSDGMIFDTWSANTLSRELWEKSEPEKRCPYVDFDGLTCYCKATNSPCDTASIQLWCLVPEHKTCIFYQEKEFGV